MVKVKNKYHDILKNRVMGELGKARFFRCEKGFKCLYMKGSLYKTVHIVRFYGIKGYSYGVDKKGVAYPITSLFNLEIYSDKVITLMISSYIPAKKMQCITDMTEEEFEIISRSKGKLIEWVV